MAIKIPIISEYDKRGQNDAETGLDKLGASANKLAKIGAAAFAAVGAAALVMGKQLIDAGERSSTANARIEQITESMGQFEGATEQVTMRLVKLAEETARLVGVDQNLIKEGQALLLTFKSVSADADIVGGVFDRATKAAIDLAAAGFGEVTSNAVQLGKALEDPIKGLAALGKSGVTFTADQKELIKSFVETNEIAKAQEIILKAVEMQVGGTAEATANASDKMKVAWSQLQEQLGERLLPVFEKLSIFVIDTLIPNMEAIYNKAAPYVLEAFQRISGWIKNTGIPAFQAFVEYVKVNVIPQFTSIVKKATELVVISRDLLAPIFREALPSAFRSFGGAIPGLLKLLDQVFGALVGIAKAAEAAITALDRLTNNKATSLVGDFLGKVVVGPIGQIGPLLEKVLPNKAPAKIPTPSGKKITTPTPIANKTTPAGIRGFYQFAEGGIVTGGAMLGVIGEAGPEAVIPLDKLGRMGGGNTTININGGLASSADIGAAVVNAIRAFNRQNGPANIAVA